MIGSKYITIDWKNWVQGMTTSNVTTDGGFATGNGSSNLNWSTVNPTYSPGLLAFPAAAVDASTNLSGNIIASCDDASATYDKLFLTDSGKFYGWNGSALSAALATDATRSYVFGKTDMAPYGPYAYGTSATYIWEWIVTTATINQTYFAFPSTSGSASWNPAAVPHPVLVFEGNIYYGNGPQLLRQTAAGGTPAEILLLQNYGEVIISLGIDPGSGKMVISTSSGANASDTLPKVNRVGYYDGFSNKLLKAVITDALITTFYTVGGTLFIGYGQNFGYWTGTGIQFLRKLRLAYDNTRLLYKHHITHIDNIIYIVEQSRILAFGEVMQGQGRSWWYQYLNAPSGTPTVLTNVTNLGQDKLGFSFATDKFNTLSLTSIADQSNSGLVFTRKYDFARPVTYNNIVIDFGAVIPINTDVGYVYVYYDDDNSVLVGTVRTTQAGKWSFECPYPTIQSRAIQVRYIAALNLPLERMVIFYNDKE